MKESHDGESVSERWSPAAVVPEDAPFLEPRQGMFDSCATLAESPVAPVAEYPHPLKHGGEEFSDSPVAAIGAGAAEQAGDHVKLPVRHYRQTRPSAHVGPLSQDTGSGREGEPKTDPGPNKKPPWSRDPTEEVTVLALAFDTSDPLQRWRLDGVFAAAFSFRRRSSAR